MNLPQTVGVRAMLYETQVLLFEIHRSLAKFATREGEIRMLLDQMMHNTLSQIATVDGSVREEAPQMLRVHAEHINLANASIWARQLKPGTRIIGRVRKFAVTGVCIWHFAVLFSFLKNSSNDRGVMGGSGSGRSRGRSMSWSWSRSWRRRRRRRRRSMSWSWSWSWSRSRSRSEGLGHCQCTNTWICSLHFFFTCSARPCADAALTAPHHTGTRVVSDDARNQISKTDF
jgi:hypothetical protein